MTRTGCTSGHLWSLAVLHNASPSLHMLELLHIMCIAQYVRCIAQQCAYVLNCSYRCMSALVVLPQFCDKGELIVSALLAADPQPVDTSALQQVTTEVPPHSAVHLCSNNAHHKLIP